MTRASRADNSDAVSLFPFLAVLLCTMGSLIVLLVVVARHSRLQAATDVAETGELNQLDEQALDAELAELEQLRDRMSQQLVDGRRRLRHWESHMRRLAERLVELERQARQLAETQKGKLTDRAQAEAEDARLKELIARTRAELEKERDEARKRPKSYAVVPYRGPNETYRRPIYIECRGREVILQPEGVKFSEADFLMPLGPNNPLAAALRAAADYYGTTNEAHPGSALGDDQHEAYPLILVRPDGVLLYDAVRSAIRSWGSEFGYEMVDQDWELAFPPPNPELAALEYRAAAESRAMRAHLTSVRSRRAAEFGGGTSHDGAAPVRFRATASGGGFRREGGRPQYDWVDHGFGAGSFSERQANAGRDRATRTSAASKSSNRDATQTEKPTEPASQQDVGLDSEKPEQNDQPKRDKTGNARVGAKTSTNSTPSAQGGPGGTAVTGLSKQRGSGWARIKNKTGTVAISRPIHVICRDDRFVLLAVRRVSDGDVQRASSLSTASKNVITTTGETVKSIDDFVSAVHTHTASWGIAGRNLYWQPSIVLHVAPDGVGRAADLEVLLEDSGLEVTRSQGGRP